MVDDKINKILLSRFPGSLEAVTWRKGTQDFGVTYAVTQEMREYVKPLMDKLNQYFVIASVEVRDTQQAEQLLQSQGDEVGALPENSDGNDRAEWICGIEGIAALFSM